MGHEEGLACCAKRRGKNLASQPRKPLGDWGGLSLPFHGKTVLTGQKRSLRPESWTWAELWDPQQHIPG